MSNVKNLAIYSKKLKSKYKFDAVTQFRIKDMQERYNLSYKIAEKLEAKRLRDWGLLDFHTIKKEKKSSIRRVTCVIE